jgi:hypothetical protein
MIGLRFGVFFFELLRADLRGFEEDRRVDFMRRS